MTKQYAALLIWSPRVLGILFAGFLALFALDAFNGRSFLQALPAFAVHLIPSLIVLVVVAVAWRFPWVGALACGALAVYYAVGVRRLDWIAVISGPLALVALLFLLSWRVRTAR
jgi:hypothetical protein